MRHASIYPVEDEKKCQSSVARFQNVRLLLPVEENSKEIMRKAAEAVGSLSDAEFNISFNSDVMQPHVRHANPQVGSQPICAKRVMGRGRNGSVQSRSRVEGETG